MKRFLLLCGVAAPIVYMGAVVLGGVLQPGYSHLSQAVSALIEAGAPYNQLLVILFALYNLLTLAFAIGLLQFVSGQTQYPLRGLGSVGAVLLALEGLFGLLTLLFPQDPGGPPTTGTGTMHVILAGLSSLASMLTILLMAFWFRAQPSLRGYATYSFVTVLVVFLSGGFAAFSVANNSPIGGLVERITIGAFLQWLLFIAIKLYSMQGHAANYALAETHGGAL